MKTSYFANLKKLDTPLSISGNAPEWYNGPQFKTLAPKRVFFDAYKRGEIDAAGYTREFKRLVLAPLDPVDVYHKLTSTYGDDVTLLCYERPGEFCHRRIVAEWFETHLGVRVPEWRPSLPQGGLFKLVKG